MDGRKPKSGSGGGGSPVYGLGFVGAVVWPAFLVYAALRALEGQASKR